MARGEGLDLRCGELWPEVLGREPPAADDPELGNIAVRLSEDRGPVAVDEAIVVHLAEVAARRSLQQPVNRLPEPPVTGVLDAVVKPMNARMIEVRLHELERFLLLAVVPDPNAHRFVARGEKPVERKLCEDGTVVGDHQDVDGVVGRRGHGGRAFRVAKNRYRAAPSRPAPPASCAVHYLTLLRNRAPANRGAVVIGRELRDCGTPYAGLQ